MYLDFSDIDDKYYNLYVLLVLKQNEGAFSL